MTDVERTSPVSGSGLVFTVGLNGYAERYERYVASQRSFAERNGYQYLVVTEPSGSYGASEAAWLKIAVINDALRAGFERVVFFDCDAEVLETAPPVAAAMDVEPQAHIYLVRGHSGRFNSGVVMVRNGEPAQMFFKEIWARMGTPLSQADDVGWGENGHVIQLSKEVSCIAELPRSWNNTRLPPPDPEYVRHHTGPIRAEENRQRAEATGEDTVSRPHPLAGRLTTSLDDSVALIAGAGKLAAEYSPSVPTPRQGR